MSGRGGSRQIGAKAERGQLTGASARRGVSANRAGVRAKPEQCAGRYPRHRHAVREDDAGRPRHAETGLVLAKFSKFPGWSESSGNFGELEAAPKPRFPYEPVAIVPTAVSGVILHIDTARKCAIAPSGGQISVISGTSDCRFGGSREPSDFCNRLLCYTPARRGFFNGSDYNLESVDQLSKHRASPEMKRNRVQVQKRLSPSASLRWCGTEGQCADTPAVDRWPQVSASPLREPRPWQPADPGAVAMPMASLSVGGVPHGRDDLRSQQTAAGRLVPRHPLARPNSKRGVVLGTRMQGGREPERCLEGQSQVVRGDQGTRRTDRPPRPVQVNGAY